jgi:GTP cyclohydrolase IA
MKIIMTGVQTLIHLSFPDKSRRMENNLDKLFSFINSEEVRAKLKNSKERIQRSFDQQFSGYSLKAEDVLNETLRLEEPYEGIVEVRDINFYTFCEHHFAPFFGTANVYYQPNEIITGLGKIVRLVKDVHARRLQIQEIMTKQIAEDLMRVLNAKGVYVETAAKHLCICSRGPGDDTAVTNVSYGLGTLSKWCLNRK